MRTKSLAWCLFSVILLWTGVASAQSVQGKHLCVNAPKIINAATMESTRTFALDFDKQGGWDVLGVYLNLTDANTSITRLDMTCTASLDGNTTDFKLQTCTMGSGVCTSDDSSWRKASPGSTKWVWRVDVATFQDIECSVAVGAGAGAAADLITVDVRACTE